MPNFFGSRAKFRLDILGKILYDSLSCKAPKLYRGGTDVKNQTYRMTMLFDFYGDLLTDKQREYYDLHYNQDLSLAEIAASSGISRQGVWDNIRRADAALRDTEARLGLVQRFAAQRTAAAALEDTLTKLRDTVGGDARLLAEQALRQLQDLKG